MPRKWADAPPWFEDNPLYENQRFGIDAETGREYVLYTDENGSVMRQKYDPETDTVFVPQYQTPQGGWKNETPGVDVFQDIQGHWWRATWDPEVGFPSRSHEIYNLREGWHVPNEDEPQEPLAHTQMPQDKKDDVLPDLPPGIELSDVQEETSRGKVHYEATDQYGRQWQWERQLEDPTNPKGDLLGIEGLSYRDTADNWHDVNKHDDGTWHDTWTDSNGNKFDNDRLANELTPEQQETMYLHNAPGRYGESRHLPGERTPEEIQADLDRFAKMDAQAASRAPGDDKPTEGGDQEGQPPIIDPNAPPTPMPSFPGGGEGEEGPPPYGQFPMGKDPNTGEWVPGTIDPETGEFHPFESGADEGGEDQPPPYGQFPMIKDPATGEWVPATYDLETGEFRPIEGGAAGEGGIPAGPPPVLDPNAQPMPMPSPDQPTGLDPDAPVPYEDYIPFFPMVKDPATGEWRNAQEGEIPGLGEDQVPPGTQTPEAEPPAQPTPPGDDAGGGGFEGMGQRHVEVMPALFEDPTTGEWRVMVQDPTTGEWRPPQPAESPDPNILPDLFDPSAPGPTLDSDLLDPSAPGPTLYPALLDPYSPGPTVDADLLDPTAPGPTLDPALLDPNSPGPTVHPNQLDPSAPGPTLDPAQLEQGIVEPSSGGAQQPAEVTGQGFTDPLLPESAHPEPSTAPRQDHLDDSLNLG